MKHRSCLVSTCLFLAVTFASGQTYDVNGQSASQPGQSAQKNLGWGSSIEVARQARAAQDALKRGDYAAAANYAEQAAKSAPSNADLWFLLGYCDRLAGRYPASLDAYNRGLQAHPNDVSGLAGLAQTYVKMGRSADAQNILLKVVAARPKDANSLQLVGELLLTENPQQALQLLLRANALQPSARAELLISRAYQQLRQPAQAQRYLDRAKAQAPHDPDILRAVAGEYSNQGHYDEAIRTLQSIPQKSPDLLAELAYTYELAGKKDKAAEMYSRLARSSKNNIGLQLSAAQAELNEGHVQSADSFLQAARQLDPDSYRLHAILGEIAKSQGSLPDAIHEYEIAVQHLPPRVAEGPLYPIQLRMSLHDLYTQANNQAAAKQQLDSAAAELQQVPSDAASTPEYFRLRADVESSSGQLDAAEKDLKQALALAPTNVDVLLNYASLLWKRGDKDQAHTLFLRAAKLDHDNDSALVSLGYLARDMGDSQAAEDYFTRASKLRPKDYRPYLALGDLQSSQKQYPAAERNYGAAYERMPSDALIVAGGANAALEAHDLPLAARWLSRAKGPIADNPQVMRERERYLTWKGQYAEAADLGYKVIQRLPRDAEAPVYLAYDLYYLGRYQDALALAARYDSILPGNKDMALIRGYINAHAGQLQDALADFTLALKSDPKMATGYVNRGYVLNDLRKPQEAASDFQRAVALDPEYPEAHLGLAYSYLQLHRPGPALKEIADAKGKLGTTRVWHLARGEAFRQEARFSMAAPEYRAALRQKPDDLTTQLTLADVLYHMRHYNQSIQELKTALKLSPDDAAIYASMAESYACLGQQPETLRYVQAAEQRSHGEVGILMTTGDALMRLGDRDAAMKRFSRALETDDRVGIRLAIAQIFVKEGHFEEARRQVGMAFAEARVGDAPPVTADDFVEAANIFLATHDFDLAQTYFSKARQAGANPRVVAIGLTNTYLAEGYPGRAQVELAVLGDPDQHHDDYDYMMALGNLYREQQDPVHALAAFSQARTLAGSDDESSVQSAQFQMASEEGRRITQNVSLLSQATFAPTLEDINVYTLDAKLLKATAPGELPLPRHSFESGADEHYRVQLKGLPPITGFVGEHMYTGQLSFPSVDLIQDRNTYDTVFNGGISPQLRLGSATFSFQTGLQFTLRRDTISPFYMNQNLFRQYLYLSTSSFFNWLSINGGVSRETGPFEQQNLHSRDAWGNIEFVVGRPWGHTAFLAGYSGRDLLFRPAIREYFSTSTYAGLQHKFSRFSIAGLAEYLRSWRVDGTNWAIAQAMRPAVRFEYAPTSRWHVQGDVLLSRGEGFHAYDNVQSQLLISYMHPVRGKFEDGDNDFTVSYPFQFSFGVEEQTFYDFPGSTNAKTMILPVVHLKLF